MSDKVKDFVKTQKKLSPKERKESYSNSLPDLLKNESGSNTELSIYESAIDNLLNFYKDLSLCVKVNKCDRDTICQFFFSDINAFRHTYRPVLDKWFTYYGDNSDGILSEFVRKCSDQFNEHCQKNPTSKDCEH